jgi:hypothetical protein
MGRESWKYKKKEKEIRNKGFASSPPGDRAMQGKRLKKKKKNRKEKKRRRAERESKQKDRQQSY